MALGVPMLAQASTLHDVLYTGTFTEDVDLANGTPAPGTLTTSNGASVSVKDPYSDGIYDSFLGFQFEPESAATRFSVSLDEVDDELYGGMDVSIFADMAKTTLLASGTVDGPDYRLSFGIDALSPIWVHLDWTGTVAAKRTTGGNSFNYDIEVVPLPAAGLLLIGALGGLAGFKRRRKA
jgi:hypothetical protein